MRHAGRDEYRVKLMERGFIPVPDGSEPLLVRIALSSAWFLVRAGRKIRRKRLFEWRMT